MGPGGGDPRGQGRVEIRAEGDGGGQVKPLTGRNRAFGDGSRGFGATLLGGWDVEEWLHGSGAYVDNVKRLLPGNQHKW